MIDLDHAERELFEYVEKFYSNQQLRASLAHVLPAILEVLPKHQKEA